MLSTFSYPALNTRFPRFTPPPTAPYQATPTAINPLLSLLSAMMQGSNQLFSGFQSFGGGLPKTTMPSFGGGGGGVVQTQQILQAQFHQASASLQGLQMQTAMQMQSILHGGF